MLSLVSSLVLATSVPTPGAELLQSIQIQSIQIDVPAAHNGRTLAQMSDEEREAEEDALEEDMAKAREKLGHTPEPSTSPAPAPADAPVQDEGLSKKEKKRLKKEERRRERELRKQEKRNRKKNRGPEPQLEGKTRGRYLIMGIIDANLAVWSLAGAAGATAVAVVFADLDRRRTFGGDIITPDTDAQRRIAIGFAATAGVLYAVAGIAAWRTGHNFKRFGILNKQRREQRKAQKKLSMSPATWELMGVYGPMHATR